MAKKKSSSGSSRSDMLAVSRVLAFVALLLAVVLLLVVGILRQTDTSWSGVGVLNLIKDLALICAIAIPAYYFVKPKKQVWRIIYWICIIVVIVAAVLGNFNIF